jgi:hypothetical protein
VKRVLRVVLVALAALLLGAGCTGAGRGVRAGYAGYTSYAGAGPWAGWGYDRIHVRQRSEGPGGPDLDPPVVVPPSEPPTPAAEPILLPDVGMPDSGGFDAVPMEF